MFVSSWDGPRMGLLLELWVALDKARMGFAFALFFTCWSLEPLLPYSEKTVFLLIS